MPEERNRLAALFVRDEHLEGVNPLKMFDDLRKDREKEALRRIKELKKELIVEEAGSCRYMEILGEINSLCNKKSQLQ